jgi:hypothetical protein
MNSITLKWINVTRIFLFVTVLVLLFLILSWSVGHLISPGAGWHELVSVGWVTGPG